MFFEHDRGKTHSLGQAAVLGADHSVPRLVARFRIRSEGHPVLPRRPPPQDAGDDPAEGDRPSTTEQILAHFFVFDNFHAGQEGRADGIRARAPARRSRALRHRSTRTARCSSQKDKRITARHIRDLDAAGIKKIAVPDDYLLGRVLAQERRQQGYRRSHRQSANDELTEELLDKLREAGVAEIQTLYTNDLDQGPYISQTLRIDDTADQMAARIAIYRMMRPGEPPTEEAVEALFNGLFFSEERYDLSAVGPHEVQPPRRPRRAHRPDDAARTTTSSR